MGAAACLPEELLPPAEWSDHNIIQKIRSMVAYAPDHKYQISSNNIGAGSRNAKMSWLLLSVALLAACLIVYEAGYTYSPLQIISGTALSSEVQLLQDSPEEEVDELLKILRAASMPDKTVIVTIINEAWAAPMSVFDIFLESLRIGNNTSSLIKHVMVVTLDSKAYSRCRDVHPHCYPLQVEDHNVTNEAADFLTPKYLKIVWRKIEVQRSILQYGYNFLFTDVDIMWFRNPFLHFYRHVDIQISCDWCNRDPFDMENKPNSGFIFVESNNRSIEFYNFWLNSQKTYPELQTTQDVLNKIKFDPYIQEIALRMRFLDPDYFGGFCQASQDLNKVCTMHANCCVGLNEKIHDLKLLLEDWKTFVSLPEFEKVSRPFRWRVPSKCLQVP